MIKYIVCIVVDAVLLLLIYTIIMRDTSFDWSIYLCLHVYTVYIHSYGIIVYQIFQLQRDFSFAFCLWVN